MITSAPMQRLLLSPPMVTIPTRHHQQGHSQEDNRAFLSSMGKTLIRGHLPLPVTSSAMSMGTIKLLTLLLAQQEQSQLRVGRQVVSPLAQQLGWQTSKVSKELLSI